MDWPHSMGLFCVQATGCDFHAEFMSRSDNGMQMSHGFQCGFCIGIRVEFLQCEHAPRLPVMEGTSVVMDVLDVSWSLRVMWTGES